jgi:glycosyltransferase involved in cell wall biosynthesis
MSAKISIITITHNRGPLLVQAIESVLAQKFPDWELVIIDDASTDNTKELVQKYLTDTRVKYAQIAKAASVPAVRNAAWPYVGGEYIAVLDSDDIWCDDGKLAKQYAYLQAHPEVVLVGSGAIVIDGNGRELSRIVKPETDAAIRQDFFLKNPFFHSSVLYRYAPVRQLGGYDEQINFGEDLDLWLRLGQVGQLYNSPELLIKYRIHEDNAAKKNYWGAIVDVWRLIKKNRRFYGADRLTFLKKIVGKFSEAFKKNG